MSRKEPQPLPQVITMIEKNGNVQTEGRNPSVNVIRQPAPPPPPPPPKAKSSS